MNDLGLEHSVQEMEGANHRQLERGGRGENGAQSDRVRPVAKEERASGKAPNQSPGIDKGEESDSNDDTGEGLYQSTIWWFTSTLFPLIAGCFGPIANLFSICALSNTWRQRPSDGHRISDPTWLVCLNAWSLVFAIAANVALLLNFSRRLRYAIAQPFTISLWYLACLFLILPIGLIQDSSVSDIDLPPTEFSQAYYYGLISSIIYFVISTLLLISTLGATRFHKYPASFSILTYPQRTLMLQSISFSVYLALGAGVFSRIEGWNISDGIYWADYTLLTVGLGSDFPLTTTLAKILLLPYAVVGITMVGLIVSSVRGLVLERAKAKVVRRYLGKERDKWHAELKARRSGRDATTSRNSRSHLGSLGSRLFDLVQSKTKKETNELLFQLYEHAITESKRSMPWHKTEYEVMRFIEASADSAEMYTGLWVSLLILAFVWIGGSLVFWSLQKTTEWTYLDSIFFTYTTLLTIGYGDYYPTSSAAKPFFVVWTLIAVPAMTVLISNIGDSVIKWVKDATMWFGKWTVDVPGVYASNDHGKRAEVRGKAKMVLRHALPTPTESHDCRTAEVDQTDSISETKKNLINSESSNHRRDAEAESLDRNVDQSDRSKITPSDDLSTRIANEIGALLADVGENPPLKYKWERWELWLHLLGEKKAEGAADNVREMNAMDLRIGDVGDAQTVVKNDAKSERQRSLGRDLHDGDVGKGVTYGRNDNELQNQVDLPVNRKSESARSTDANSEEDWSWTWTWLGDDGPLFSRLTETEWILEKLCARLKEVLGNEISESRNGRKFSTSTTLPNL